MPGKEIPAVELIPQHTVVKGIGLFNQLPGVLLPGVHPGGQITVGPGAGRVAPEHGAQHLFPRADVLHVVLWIHHPEGRDHKIGGVGLGGGDELFGKVRGQPVVAVHELDVAAMGQRKPLIAGVRRAGIGLVHQRDAVVLSGKSTADREGVVFGAVVQQDDLDAFIALGTDAFYTAGNAACGVVHGHDDADKGKFHSVSFSQMRLWVRAAASESRCTGPLGRGLSNRLR